MKRQELVDAIAIAIGAGLANEGYGMELADIPPYAMQEFMYEYRDAARNVVRIPCIAALVDEREPS
jgi:hypothetical protein